MTSTYYSNTQHIDFESVLAMDDPGMVSMFQALMASGLEGFLGCPAVIYEAALVVFFENASVLDGVIISTVAGQLVEISEEWFAESFDLPMDGLADLSEITKDVVFYARSIVSMSGEPVNLSGKKSQLKIEYCLLCDIMAKSIYVKAGSFNAITVEKFSMLTAVVYGVRMNWASVLFNILKKMVTPGSKQAKGFVVQISLLLENIANLELGESSEFPASKILTENTVHCYVSLNDKVVDWAVKMRIRPPELETSICDVKYHVSLSTRCVLGKWVYLLTLVMSLFDLRDICIAIGSLATLDIPMVVDLIGIRVLKGPYCTLTMTNWFLQALSVIPRGSWGDVARHFTLIRWRAHGGTVAARSYSADGRPPCAIVAHGGARHLPPTCARCARRWPPPCATIARASCGSVPHTVVGAAIRRTRGGVATADLSSRFCFRPVPSSPRSFRANI
ncbi:hypothetical protein F511_34413 [Dorcoceras hygrometricum]|uniref:Dystroglycan-like n=1 Tax=Dorcoceras hygrometricum TaxID=472368 RepID=A0A2Z7CFE6_9LAMI|nr:hypothetical protein F511_34413 [Dorcoceras hygrometricum]